jgi:glutamine synthetase
VGRSGRTITGGQAYSIAGVNEFDELIDDIYHFCDKQGLEIDTLIHEEGPSQLEINLRHGDPVALADQVFLMKRTIREAALKHDMYATFMAKPMQGDMPAIGDAYPPVGGRRQDRQEHLLRRTASRDGGCSQLHRRHAALRAQGAGDDGALCQLLPAADAGHGLRRSTPPGATTTAPPPSGCRPPNRWRGGWKTGCRRRTPTPTWRWRRRWPAAISAWSTGWCRATRPETANEGSVSLPRGLLEAVSLLESEPGFAQVFGQEFINTYAGVKRGEFETFMQVISPWEREFLLLNV